MKNKEYWHKRFTELENQNTNKTAKYYENLERQFKNANKKIEAELLTWYRRFAINNNITLAEAKRILNSIANVGWISGGHSAGYVPVFAIGANAQLFQGRIDNTEIPEKIAEAAGYKH